VLIGLITGGLLAAFFLGFRVGKKEQFDAYASLSLERFPRLPITEDVSSRGVSERLVEEVYDKLQRPPATSAEDSTSAAELELKPVKIVPMPEIAEFEEKEVLSVSDGIEVKERELISPEQPEVQTVEQGLEKVREEMQASRIGDRKKRTVMTLDRLAADVDANEASSDVSGEEREGMVQETSVDGPAVKLRAPNVNAVSASSRNYDSPSASESLRSGWYVQLAAFESKTEANELLALLRQNGFRDSYIQEAIVKKRRYFRVLVGPEENSVLAKRLKEQLLRESYLMREPYQGFKPYLKKVD
jgi:cell division septation protein DedD